MAQRKRYPCAIDTNPVPGFNGHMSRCNACYSVITKRDSVCYVCGEQVPRYARLVSTRKNLSWFSNVLFLVSLGFTGFSFFAGHKLPLPYSLAVSCSLLALKVVADRYSNQAEARGNR